jgi:hypothetical protein
VVSASRAESESVSASASACVIQRDQGLPIRSIWF